MDGLDNRAFQELLKKWPSMAIRYVQKHYYSRLIQIAEQRTRNRGVSEDIVQEALIEMWRKSRWLAEQEGLLIIPYVMAIVKYKAISFFNKSVKKERSFTFDVLDAFVSKQPNAEIQMIASDHCRQLREIVSRLSEREKLCVHLKYFRDMSNDSIANQLGVSKKTVEKHLTHALKQLRLNKNLLIEKLF